MFTGPYGHQRLQISDANCRYRAQLAPRIVGRCSGTNATAVARPTLRLRAADLAGKMLAVQLLLRRGGFHARLLRLALAARLHLGALGAGFGTQLLALVLAGGALAADGLQIGFEIIGAVIVVDL